MSLGMPEVVLILVIALIVFGPRKLPELGKSLGQAMAQFRRASDDFKRTWEQEVEYEKVRKDDTATTNYDHNSAESNHSYNPYDPESPPDQEQLKPRTAVSNTEAVASTTAKAPAKHWI